MSDGTQLCNSAGVSTTTVDPILSNNTAQTCGSVSTRADLALTQSVVTDGKGGRGTATFTMTVRNNGPSDAQNINMVASSSLFTGPSAATITTTPAGTCTVAGGTVSCTWTSLAVGAVSTARLPFHAIGCRTGLQQRNGVGRNVRSERHQQQRWRVRRQEVVTTGGWMTP
jgi:hypothetical protein